MTFWHIFDVASQAAFCLLASYALVSLAIHLAADTRTQWRKFRKDGKQ